jgi:autophagy-related protein 13
MHQYPRPSPRTASAANNLQTNPTRTNNQREPTSERSSPYSDTASYSDRGPDDGDGEMVTRVEQMSETEQRNYQKVNQVIQVRIVIHAFQGTSSANYCPQNFFTKAALTIVSSRVMLPQSFTKSGDLRQNKWVRLHISILFQIALIFRTVQCRTR